MSIFLSRCNTGFLAKLGKAKEQSGNTASSTLIHSDTMSRIVASATNSADSFRSVGENVATAKLCVPQLKNGSLTNLSCGLEP